MYNDYYTRNNISTSNFNNQQQYINNNINYTNTFLQPSLKENQLNKNIRFQNNYIDSNNHPRGISEDIENRRINNVSSNFNPNTSSSNWQKLKDQILSPGDEENYYNNSQINIQNQNITIPQYNLQTYNIKNYNRSSSSSRLNRYNTINTNNSYLPFETLGGKKTLILDLDETLVHSAFKPFFIKSDINLNVNVDGINHLVHVLKRPYVDEFLQRMSKFYELVIFTASISNYANPLLDRLDKFRIISHRLFREHCVSNRGLYIKDLRKLGRDLKNMIIIDNNPISYAVNQDNGIPILTWHYDKNDNELMKLIPILEFLSNVDDVRPYIMKIVKRNTNEIDFNIVNNILNENKNTNVNNNNNMKINIDNLNNVNNQNVGKNNNNNNNIMENMKRFSNGNISNFQDNVNINLNNREQSVVIPPNTPSRILSDINNNLNKKTTNNLQSNNTSSQFRPYTANVRSYNNINRINMYNNNLNNNNKTNSIEYNSNKNLNNNILSYKSQLAYTPKINYRNIEVKNDSKEINNNKDFNNNDKQIPNYASYTGMYLNRGHEQIKNDLDDISNFNTYSTQENNNINEFQRNTNNININIVNQNFNFDDNKAKNNIQDRTKETIYYQGNGGKNDNIKKINNNSPNNNMLKNYTQNSLNNLKSITNKINEINKTLSEYSNETIKYNLYNNNNKNQSNQTKANYFMPNYQTNIRTSTPQLYRNNISMDEGINNYQAKYNLYNRNENTLQLKNNLNNINNNNNNTNTNIDNRNRSSSLFYPRKNVNIDNTNQNEETEEAEDLNFLQSNYSINNYVKTPQRNFDRSILLTPNRRYNEEIININNENNYLNNSRSVERPKRFDISPSPYLQERENNLKFGNGNFINYDDYMRNRRPYQYGINNNINNNNEVSNFQSKDRYTNYANLYGNNNNNITNNIHSYNYYSLIRNFGNNNNNFINNMNNNNMDYISNYRSNLNRPFTNLYSNNINNFGRNYTNFYQNIGDRRYYNF